MIRTHASETHHSLRMIQLYRDCLRVADHIASKVSMQFKSLCLLPVERSCGLRSSTSLHRDLPCSFSFLCQSPKGIALRNMLRSEFKKHANVEDGKQVEQLKMK